MKSQPGTFSQWRLSPAISWDTSTSRSATGEAKRYKTEIWLQLLRLLFFGLQQSGGCFSCLVENGGAAGQDEKREANFHSLLRLCLQRSAREVLARLSASRQTPVSRTCCLCGDAALINVE